MNKNLFGNLFLFLLVLGLLSGITTGVSKTLEMINSSNIDSIKQKYEEESDNNNRQTNTRIIKSPSFNAKVAKLKAEGIVFTINDDSRVNSSIEITMDKSHTLQYEDDNGLHKYPEVLSPGQTDKLMLSEFDDSTFYSVTKTDNAKVNFQELLSDKPDLGQNYRVINPKNKNNVFVVSKHSTDSGNYCFLVNGGSGCVLEALTNPSDNKALITPDDFEVYNTRKIFD